MNKTHEVHWIEYNATGAHVYEDFFYDLTDAIDFVNVELQSVDSDGFVLSAVVIDLENLEEDGTATMDAISATFTANLQTLELVSDED